MKYILLTTILTLSAMVAVATAQDRVEIESIVIKGNKEFPQILYIVPWKEMKSKSQKEQTLVLHSIFGDLFDPVNPEWANGSQPQVQK
jgi:hypothetical protein